MYFEDRTYGARTVMIVPVASLFLSMFVSTVLGACPHGFTCKRRNDTYEMICNLRVDEFMDVELTDIPPQKKRLDVKCFNSRPTIILTLGNLSHIRELTLEGQNFLVIGRHLYHRTMHITHLVLRNVNLWKSRLRKGHFDGLADLQSLTIEHIDNLKYIHRDLLVPLVSLESLSFRNIGSTYGILQYADYSRMLRGIRSSGFHTLVLHAIHTSHDDLDIDNLFRNVTFGASLKYLDLSNNNVNIFSGSPKTTLPSLEYISLAGYVIQFSLVHYAMLFWVELIGHMSLKRLDISDLIVDERWYHFSCMYNRFGNGCRRDSRLTMGPRLESISLRNTIVSVRMFNILGMACFYDRQNVVKYIDISKSRWLAPLYLADQLKGLEYFNMQNVSEANIPTDLFSKIPNLTVLLMGKNRLGDVVANDNENRLFYNKSKLRVLDLAQCQLTEIPPTEFSNLRQLKHLNLSGNYLRHFHMDMQNVTNIRIINLSRNNLTTLGATMRTQLDKMAATRRVDLDLNGNPLRCTCTETDFVTWTHVSKVRFLNKDETFCYDRSKRKYLLFQFDSKDFEMTCHPDHLRYLRIVLSVVFTCVAVVIVACAVYNYRWKCAYMWSRATLRRTDSDIELEQAVYERDVFVCYNSTDSGWVCHDLLDTLNKHKIKTVIHHRDFLPGDILEEIINESIAKCRYTLLVLSPDFLASNWCLLEMHLARNRIIIEGRDVIIPIILREFPTSLMTRTLEGILSKSYLQWTTDPDGQALFWDKLTTKLKRGGNLRPLKM